MKTRIEHCPAGGLNWFVDVLTHQGWKNAASFSTKEQALRYIELLRNSLQLEIESWN